MKIFSWIHLRLHPGYTNYSQVPHEKGTVLDRGDDHEGDAAMPAGKKAAAAAEKETKALLLHDMLNGILTIGTLGHGHPLLLPSTYTASTEIELAKEDQATKIEEEQQQQQNGDGEGDGVDSPLPITKAAEQKETEIMVARVAAAMERSCEISAVDPLKIEEASKAELKAEEVEKIQELPLLKEQKKAKQVRTTLADLFAADDASFSSEESIKAIDCRGNFSSSQRAIARPPKEQIRKSKKSNAEKSTTSNKKSPSKKLQKLITRMLKKKIHPEVAAAAGKAKEAVKQSCKGDGMPLIMTVPIAI